MPREQYDLSLTHRYEARQRLRRTLLLFFCLWGVFAAYVLFSSEAKGQNKFYATPNRGVEGARGNAQIQMLMEENVERRSEVNANSTSITAITEELLDIETHARRALAACASAGKVLQWNGSVWGCANEADPTVGPHARLSKVPPYCHETNAKLLWSVDGAGSWKCVAEGDIKIGNLLDNRYCRASAGKIVCDAPKHTGYLYDVEIVNRSAIADGPLNDQAVYHFSVSATCPVGKIVIGGGCNQKSGIHRALVDSHPDGTNSWRCWGRDVDHEQNVLMTAYAICARKSD